MTLWLEDVKPPGNSLPKASGSPVAANHKKAVKTKPSYPNLVDEYQPTDEKLWETVLEVASGTRLKYKRDDREINAPNGTRGYRNMPHNPKGIAWAVKQYKGFGGNWKKSAKDKIPGGLADKGAPKNLDPKQLAMGIEVEMEHTTDKAVAKEIALDHLTEDPNYYSKLQTIEKHALSIDETRMLKQELQDATVVRELGSPVNPRVMVASGKQAADKYDHIDFKPPEAVANAAKKGLEYRKKQGADKAGLTPEEASKEGIGSGVQRATNLKNRDTISPDVIRQMVGFFSRHKKNKSIKPEFKDEPWKDKGYVSWCLWGGDPGEAWANKVKKQMEAADKKTLKKAAIEYLPDALYTVAKDVKILSTNLKLMKPFLEGIRSVAGCLESKELAKLYTLAVAFQKSMTEALSIASSTLHQLKNLDRQFNQAYKAQDSRAYGDALTQYGKLRITYEKAPIPYLIWERMSDMGAEELLAGLPGRIGRGIYQIWDKSLDSTEEAMQFPGTEWDDYDSLKALFEDDFEVKLASDWGLRLARMAAGGIEVTDGPDPDAEKLVADGTIKLAAQDGLRWYWDLTDKGRQAQQKPQKTLGYVPLHPQD